ncbi:hypothetical protein J1614_001052 [Plenodomus biglobosus]|nr:hypothetical protein J1614_001052 [Plenodomus biglobosus]
MADSCSVSASSATLGALSPRIEDHEDTRRAGRDGKAGEETASYQCGDEDEVQRVWEAPVDAEVALKTCKPDSSQGRPQKSETLPASSAPTSSYSFRNRGARQNKLVYDLKYHPMDDSIRPSQAAKRRSAHGEQLLSSGASIHFFSTRNDADTQPSSDYSIEEGRTRKKVVQKHVSKGKKRPRQRSQSPRPTRRSSRRVSDEKKPYDMSVHPQDKDLELLSSDGEEVSRPFSRRRKDSKKSNSNGDRTTEISTKSDRTKQTIISSDSGSTVSEEEDVALGGSSFDTVMQMSPQQTTVTNDACPRSISPTTSVPLPAPHGIRRRESLDVWKLFPGDRYFRHDQASQPFTPGQPFDIWAEQAEDQVAEEALAAFPLNFEHDDKENRLDHTDLQSSDPLEGIAVIPASQYRRSDEDVLDAQNTRLVAEALYDDEEIDFDTYGLDSTDGANDEGASCRQVLGGNEDIMRLLASGAHSPQKL